MELHVLSKIHDIPIIVFNDDSNIIYLFNDGIKYHHLYNKSVSDVYTKTEFMKSAINLRFSFVSNKKVPDEIEIIYHK